MQNYYPLFYRDYGNVVELVCDGYPVYTFKDHKKFEEFLDFAYNENDKIEFVVEDTSLSGNSFKYLFKKIESKIYFIHEYNRKQYIESVFDINL